MKKIVVYSVIARFTSLRHLGRLFSRGNFRSANIIASDVTSLGYVTHVTIKGRELIKLTKKKDKRS